MSIKKAVILAGGNGTRMLPITSILPKELLPVGNIPIIDYILQECIQSGIVEITTVINEKKGKLLEYIIGTLDDQIKKNVKFTFVPQRKEYGTAAALLSCLHCIRDEDFAVILPDEVFITDVPPLKQLINCYEKTGDSIVGVFRANEKNFHQYGIIDYTGNKTMILRNVVEKPKENPPSYLALCGRYIFNRKITDYLYDLSPNNEEYYLTDAIKKAIKIETIRAKLIHGKRYDCGSISGYKRLVANSLHRE